MKKFSSSIAFGSLVLGVVVFTPAGAAAPAASECAAKAVTKDGKDLSGAAKNSFMKKCEAETQGTPTSCSAKAVDKNGKPLAGAAKSSFVKKCEAASQVSK